MLKDVLEEIKINEKKGAKAVESLAKRYIENRMDEVGMYLDEMIEDGESEYIDEYATDIGEEGNTDSKLLKKLEDEIYTHIEKALKL